MASDGYTCPVCGWPHLDEPHRLPEGDPSFEVCVSCGTEFGNDDFGTTHEALRKRWLEERGGAQARMESLEILDVTEIERKEDGFRVRSTWTVGGLVTHFGHRHFRQNRYDAHIVIVPVDEMWKIRSIEILEQDRLK